METLKKEYKCSACGKVMVNSRGGMDGWVHENGDDYYPCANKAGYNGIEGGEVRRQYFERRKPIEVLPPADPPQPEPEKEISRHMIVWKK